MTTTHDAAEPGLSGRALLAFVFGLLWLLGAGSLVAIALGIGAVREIRAGGRTGMPFAVAGIFLGVCGTLLGALAVVGLVS